MVVVPGVLAELVVPKGVEVGTLAGAVAPKVALALVAEDDSKAAQLAEVEAAHEAGPRAAELVAEVEAALEAGPMVADYLTEVDTALEVGPMLAGLAAVLEEEPSHSWPVEAELGAERVEASPREAVRAPGLELAPAVVLELGPRNYELLVAVLVQEPRTSQGQRGSLWENVQCHLLPMPLAVAVVVVEVEVEVEVEAEVGAGTGPLGHSMWALAQEGCWQGPLGEQGEERAEQQVPGLAPGQQQGPSPRWGQQQVWPHYFQRAQSEAPGWSVRSAGSMVERRG